MKRLSDILYGVALLETIGSTDIGINDITFDSRTVQKGSLFIAIKGTVTDGHHYITDVIQKGAIAIVCETLPESVHPHVTYVRVAASAIATAVIAANFYNNPSKKIKVVSVTGTNGKTTVATLLYRLFSSLGYKTGLLSTIENRIGETVLPATHTTPDSITLNKLLAQMVSEGCVYCFMEASSHAIHQERVKNIAFTGAIFTNITRDHLDYHGTFENYIKAKKKLFDELPASAFALSNGDDKNGRIMLQNTKAKKHYYSLLAPAEFHAKLMENSFEGMLINIDGTDVHTSLCGEFNAYNLLAIYGATRLLGINKEEALTALSKLKPAEGRFDYIISPNQKIIGIVDYAHTPDALEKVLTTIQKIRTGNEKLITVVGCGGDRDKGKRPMMAKVASAYSDRLILTSDNPRSENPDSIIQDMRIGILPHKQSSTLMISDRREAIRAAVQFADAHDIILIAGKGHEKYQEIQGVKHPFDDKQILNETLLLSNK
jgi:UDP-N-acetylmuramoyl-L-alanyl-D-glutamate--2,6-diaminopimelate ligase